MIPYGRQDVTAADIDAVIGVLRSDFLTQGPAVPHFERVVADGVGAKYAVAVNSATSALHVACLALGLGPDGLLWTVPNTFVASANCGRYCGAAVDFVDIDPATWNLSVPRLREKLVAARAVGRLPTVVVPVHFSGQPTEQEAIWALAKEYGFRVIEDASHAIGASRNGEAVGSCRWSDITIFSFHPVKVITSAEGGMALTNDPELAGRMAMLRSHGITRDADRFVDNDFGDAGAPSWYYEQQTLGFNYRLTDLHAALGASQHARLAEYVERRNELAERYDRALSGMPLQLPTLLANNRSAFHLYVVHAQTPKGDNGQERRRLVESLRRLGVGVNLHYMPVHLQPYYRALGFTEGQFPAAEAHGRTALSLPLYPTLTSDEQNRVVTAMAQSLGDD